MRAVLLASLVASILVTLPPAALQAQGGKVPKRPNLEEGADTNFAPAYYEFGMRKIERDPQKRSEEHTSELQSLAYLVCRLLLEKKKQTDACHLRFHGRDRSERLRQHVTIRLA